jgi:4-amino-4-deoxy-L-arabinose transferase-like glycosyltransferase
VLRFWRLGEVALIGDESYYWLWSEHLAPAYFDNPAGVAFVVRASTALGGQGEVGIRWLNATLGVVAVCLVYAVGTLLTSRRAGAIAAAFVAVGAPYLVVSRFVYTDALQIALLLLNLYLLAPLVVDEDRSPPNWRFWAIGLSMAALFNSKYNAYLYALAVLALLLWHRPALFGNRRTWLAMGIALCGLLPVLLWNAGRDWASFRWQFQHFGTGTVFRSTLWAKVRHAIFYLTPPLALLGALGATQVRGARRQVLLVPALVLNLPILLGPTDSPRNLLAGWALLLLLAGDALERWARRGDKPGREGRQAGVRRQALAWGVLGVLFLWASVFGVGTVAETMRPTAFPSSSIAGLIRTDALGWRTIDPVYLQAEAGLFALDYSIASQLRYYAGLDVQTAWGQYRVWGIPAICGPGAPQGDVRILALHHVDLDLVSERLRESFRQVHGPVELALGEGKMLYVWKVRGCTVDQDTFLERFDFMGLIEAMQVRRGGR